MNSPKIVKIKKEDVSYILRRLDKEFPNLIIPSGISPEKLKDLATLGLIEIIPQSMIDARNNEIGKMDTYRLSNYGFRFLNELTLRKTNRLLITLTIILVIIGVIQIMPLIVGLVKFLF